MQTSLQTAMEYTFSVSELSQVVSDALKQTFPHEIWVQGEVRDISRAQSGHVYFNLIDPSPHPGSTPKALVPVVLFETTKRVVNSQIKKSGGGMRIDDGIAVRIRGLPNFYAPQGKLSLRMTGVDPTYTLGKMAESREQLLAALAHEGLLELNRQKTFPALPIKIGLVTALGSAAEADFIEELRQSGIAFDVLLCSTPVQGVNSAQRIAASIRSCARHAVDVIALVRGGGATSDLMAFNDTVVAHTIAKCPVPVITGIGHETDSCVADYVAHSSYKTPTACAAEITERVLCAEQTAVAAWNDITNTVLRLLSKLDNNLVTATTNARLNAKTVLTKADMSAVHKANSIREIANAKVKQAINHQTMYSIRIAIETRHRLQRSRTETIRAVKELDSVAQNYLSTTTANLDRANEQVQLLDPARAFARGWSITVDANGDTVKSVSQTPAGTLVGTRVADGRIVSKVSHIDFMEETEDI